MAWVEFNSGTIKKAQYSTSKKRLIVVFSDGRFSKINDVDPEIYNQIVSLPNEERYTYYKNVIDPLASHPRRRPKLHLPRLLKLVVAAVAFYFLAKFAFQWVDRTAHALK